MRQIIVLLFISIAGRANDVYYASTSAGSNNGSSCANAYIYSDGTHGFNASGNWSGSPTGTQIGPGTTVHICGTITDSANGTLLTAQGSGASGNPVTIFFESGASLQSPGENTFIELSSNNYFIIDGGSTCGWITGARVNCNGSIVNTLNGFSGQTCPGGSCTQQIQTKAIDMATTATGLEVRNLLIGPGYIHGGTSDTTFSSPGPNCIITPANANIHNNIMHDFGW